MSKKVNFILIILFFIIQIAFVSCKDENDDPQVETTDMILQQDLTYYLKAKVLSKGDYPILDYGFEYSYGSSISGEIQSYANKKSLGKIINSDTFSYKLVTDYSYNSYYTTYCKIRAYITNEKGTVYGKTLTGELPKTSISSISPNYAKVGDTIAVNGANFGSNLSSASVKFNSTSATITSITNSKITVIVPSGISTDYYSQYITMNVTVGTQSVSLSNSFTLAPNAISFTPNSGTWNTYITITGSGLYGTSVYFDDLLVSSSNSNSNSIQVSVPSTIAKKRFSIYISKQGIKKQVPGGYFTMNKISESFTPLPNYIPGSTISFSAVNTNPSNSNNFILLGTTKIINYSYSNSPMQFIIPTQTAEGEYDCWLSNSLDTIPITKKIKIVKPKITGLSSTSGLPGSSVIIQGKYFLNSNISPSIYFDELSTYGIISSYDSTNIIIKIPWISPNTYNVKVNFGNLQITAPVKYTVTEPTISSISPASGSAGTSVIINGQGFGTSNSIYVFFGNISVASMSNTNTQINVKVPTGITSGTWLVKVRINNYDLSTTTTFVVP